DEAAADVVAVRRAHRGREVAPGRVDLIAAARPGTRGVEAVGSDVLLVGEADSRAALRTQRRVAAPWEAGTAIVRDTDAGRATGLIVPGRRSVRKSDEAIVERPTRAYAQRRIAVA